MHIDELCARFSVSRETIRHYVKIGIIPPPTIGRAARYAPECADFIAAYRALKDNNTVQRELAAHLREEGITVLDHLRRREAQIREHGMICV